MRAHTITTSLHGHHYRLYSVPTCATTGVLYSGVCRYNISITNLKAIAFDTGYEAEWVFLLLILTLFTSPDDDFGIKSGDDDIYQEDNMEFEFGFGNIIVVDNLPVVPSEKFEKLEGVRRKIYSQIGVIKEDGL